jgi:hypothetical protein
MSEIGIRISLFAIVFSLIMANPHCMHETTLKQRHCCSVIETSEHLLFGSGDLKIRL